MQQVTAAKCLWVVGRIVASLTKMNNIFIKLQIYLVSCCSEDSVVQKQWFRFPHSKSSYPWSLIAFGTWYFAWGKEVLFALCLSLSHGAAASSYHKKPPGGSQLLFLFPHLQIDLEYKVPIWANSEYIAAAKQKQRPSYCGHNLYWYSWKQKYQKFFLDIS